MNKGNCQTILEHNRGVRKSIALLIDPDDIDQLVFTCLLNNAIENKVEFIFVGGSLITSDKLSDLIEYIKSYTSIPCILFPGNAMHVDLNADAILFLSLSSLSKIASFSKRIAACNVSNLPFKPIRIFSY